MSLTLSMPQLSRTSLPMLLFPDDTYRALRIYLKQYYLCDNVQETYLMKEGSSWLSLSKQEWLSSIYSVSNGFDVSTIIPQLENKEACRRILL